MVCDRERCVARAEWVVSRARRPLDRRSFVLLASVCAEHVGSVVTCVGEEVGPLRLERAP